MPLMMTDDPYQDADRYMMAQERWLAKRPVCDCCGNHIQEETALHYVTSAVDIWLCEDCVDNSMEHIEEEEEEE